MKMIRTVSALLYTKEFEVLLHRHKRFNIYLGPGGKVEDNEHDSSALVREVYEETGIVLNTKLDKLDYQRIALLSPNSVVEIALDSGSEILYDHTYFVRVSQEIRHQQLQTESDNEMGWYDIREVLNNPDSFPLYNDTRQQLLKIYSILKNRYANTLIESNPL